MTLFSADLFRNFGIGFAAGALLVGTATAGQWAPQLESPARASSPLQAPSADAEFLIEPLEVTP